MAEVSFALLCPSRTAESHSQIVVSEEKSLISLHHLFKIRNFGRSAFAFTMAIPVSPLGASRASILEGMCGRRVPPPHGAGF